MSVQTSTSGKTVILTDAQGAKHTYSIQYSRFGWNHTVRRPGWRIQGNGLNCIVNASDIQFSTPANIISRAHELFDLETGGAA